MLSTVLIPLISLMFLVIESKSFSSTTNIYGFFPTIYEIYLFFLSIMDNNEHVEPLNEIKKKTQYSIKCNSHWIWLNAVISWRSCKFYSLCGPFVSFSISLLTSYNFFSNIVLFVLFYSIDRKKLIEPTHTQKWIKKIDPKLHLFPADRRR